MTAGASFPAGGERWVPTVAKIGIVKTKSQISKVGTIIRSGLFPCKRRSSAIKKTEEEMRKQITHSGSDPHDGWGWLHRCRKWLLVHIRRNDENR